MRKVYKSSDFIISDESVDVTNPYKPKELEKVSETVLLEESENIVSNAIKQAETIIAIATEKAETMHRGELENIEVQRKKMLADIEQQAKQARQYAFQQGYNEGHTNGVHVQSEKIIACTNALEMMIGYVEGELSGFLTEHESNLKWLALEVVEKILQVKLEEDDSIMLNIVTEVIEKVKKSDWVKVQLSNKAIGLIDNLKHIIAPHVEITTAPLPLGTCIVDTPSGILDVSILTQLENLKEYFSQPGKII